MVKYYINILGYSIVILLLGLLTHTSHQQLLSSIFRIFIIFFAGMFFCGWLIYKPVNRYNISQSKENTLKLINRVNKIPLLITISFIFLSLIYIIVSLAILSIDYEDVFSLEIILRMLNRYTILGSVITYFLMENYTIALKEKIFDDYKLIISKKTISIWHKMIMIYIAISISPILEFYFLISPYIKLDKDTFEKIFITVAVLAVTMTITTYIISRGFKKPIYILLESFKNVKKGIFNQSAVVSSDEMSILADNFNSMLTGLKEREYIRNTFGKFVTEEIASEILNGKIKLEGKTQEITIIFTDIEGYTTITEDMEPEEVVMMLNEYFSKIVAIVRKYHGIVNKFIGDAVLAIFNAPIEDPYHARHAVQCALAIELSEIKFKNKILKTRVGVNTDKVLIGNIGTPDRMEYTVIGDGVNVASRLEQLNKKYNTNILVGENTYNALKDAPFPFELLGEEHLKGKEKSTKVYKIVQ